VCDDKERNTFFSTSTLSTAYTIFEHFVHLSLEASGCGVVGGARKMKRKLTEIYCFAFSSFVQIEFL
jgi:hypothetical protein